MTLLWKNADTSKKVFKKILENSLAQCMLAFQAKSNGNNHCQYTFLSPQETNSPKVKTDPATQPETNRQKSQNIHRQHSQKQTVTKSKQTQQHSQKQTVTKSKQTRQHLQKQRQPPHTLSSNE
ncbi:MAG: hypothetical protein GY938_15095 [Ketobacter sp.]|nr:hypothetical protein [Ketobacter sp.]